jgi:hypothetical protein
MKADRRSTVASLEMIRPTWDVCRSESKILGSGMKSLGQMETFSPGPGCQRFHDGIRKARHHKAMVFWTGPWSCTNYETKLGIVRCRSRSQPLQVLACYVRMEVKQGTDG